MSGIAPVDLESETPKVEEFVVNLNEALTDEFGSIRQTDLDRPGHFEEVLLVFEDVPVGTEDVSVDSKGRSSVTQDVFIDRLGRMVLPAKAEYESLKEVHFMSENGEGPIVKEVINKEPRYEGTRKSALVVYLGDVDE